MHLLPLTSFFYLYGFTQENWIISHFKQIFLSCGNNLFDLHDELTAGVLHDGKAGSKFLTRTAAHFFNVLISVIPN